MFAVIYKFYLMNCAKIINKLYYYYYQMSFICYYLCNILQDNVGKCKSFQCWTIHDFLLQEYEIKEISQCRVAVKCKNVFPTNNFHLIFYISEKTSSINYFKSGINSHVCMFIAEYSQRFCIYAGMSDYAKKLYQCEHLIMCDK